MEISEIGGDMNNHQFMCRLCLEGDLDAFGTLSGRSICKEKSNADILEYCTGIKIASDDILTQFICYKCLAQLNASFNFLEACKKSNEKLKEQIYYGESSSSFIPDDKSTINLFKPKSVYEPVLNIAEGFFKTEIEFESPIVSERSPECGDDYDTQDPMNSENTSENEEHGLTKEQIEKYRESVMMRKMKLAQAETKNDKQEVVQCKDCMGFFRTEKGLMFHQLKVHQKDKSGLECELCSTVLKNKHCYRLHMKTVHSTKSAQCEICFKKFSCQQYLDDHKKIHQLNAAVRHRCDICKKPFSSMKSLYRHKGKIHMKIPPLKKSAATVS